MSVDVEDETGKFPRLEDVREARDVIRKYRVDMKWMMANPELAVQLGNIDRCLVVAEETIRLLAKSGKAP